MGPEVLCVGGLVADVIVRPVDALPRGRLAFTESATLAPGGCALNVALVLRKLGVASAVAGRVGKDAFGEFLLAACDAAGVGRTSVVEDGTVATATSIALVSGDGERGFLHAPGGDAAFTLADIPWDLVRSSRWVHYGGALLMRAFDGGPAAEMLRRAREAGARTSVVPVWDPQGDWRDRLGPLWRYTSVFICNADEAERLTGRADVRAAAALLAREGVDCVAVTRGAQGAHLHQAGRSIDVGAVRVNVVDATGAGDAFAAGLIAALLWEWSLERAARFASACGALAVVRLGATTGIASREEAEALAARTGLVS